MKIISQKDINKCPYHTTLYYELVCTRYVENTIHDVNTCIKYAPLKVHAITVRAIIKVSYSYLYCHISIYIYIYI